jgi:phosphotriesterase-related protein
VTGALVETVRGPVPADQLGTTLMHEHVFVLTPDSQANWPGEWDEEARTADAVARLGELRRAGVSTIVDPTVDGLGRYLPRIERVNAEVDINIVVATGIYTHAEVPSFFSFRPDSKIVEGFVSDINDGIQGTSVRAGLLKCAIDHQGLTSGVERVLRAVAAAHLSTGVPIMVHTHPGSRTGLEAARVLGEEGVSPAAVLLAHSGDTADVDHLEQLAESGFLLGMDRFGIDAFAPAEQRIAVVAEMCRRGHADKIVLSQDAACYIDWIDPSYLALMPNWNYLYVIEQVVPELRSRGVTAEHVEQMLVANPQRFLGQERTPAQAAG